MSTNPPIRPDFAPNIEDQWQMGCSTVGESIAHFFLNDFRADVYFVPLRNASNPPRKFPGHKLILLSRSIVLSAQFHYAQQQGDNKTTNNQENEKKSAPARKKAKKEVNSQDGIQEIELPDVEPDIFEEFLRFCYTDKVKFTKKNAAFILLIANQYCVPPLEEMATEFICENICVTGAFDLLQFANQYNFAGAEKIKRLALSFVCNTPQSVKTEAFLHISAETLELFVSQDNLHMTELELFTALIKWAKKEQTIAGNEEKSLRELLGPALFQVQFWKMDIQDFGGHVVPTKVLTDAETLYVFKKLSISDRYTFFSDPECPFPVREINRGCEHIHIDIQDARNFFTSESSVINQTVYIGEHWFRILGKITTQNAQDQNKKEVKFFLGCLGNRLKNDCYVFAELILVSKTPEKEDLVRKIGHRFCPRENDWSDWAFPTFIPIDDLLDPEEGWILDDTVTLKARVYVVDN